MLQDAIMRTTEGDLSHHYILRGPTKFCELQDAINDLQLLLRTICSEVTHVAERVGDDFGERLSSVPVSGKWRELLTTFDCMNSDLTGTTNT